MLEYDQERVLMGAAIHDLGKVVYTNELTGSGIQHEEIGPQLLLKNGFQEAYARFARTHAQWDRESPVQLEDVLVAFADTIWKGKRDEALEQEIAEHIGKQCQEEAWQVYMKLDDIARKLTVGFSGKGTRRYERASAPLRYILNGANARYWTEL